MTSPVRDANSLYGLDFFFFFFMEDVETCQHLYLCHWLKPAILLPSNGGPKVLGRSWNKNKTVYIIVFLGVQLLKVYNDPERLCGFCPLVDELAPQM